MKEKMREIMKREGFKIITEDGKTYYKKGDKVIEEDKVFNTDKYF